MDKIKTLVRYDANEMTIWDADDESLGFFTPEDMDADKLYAELLDDHESEVVREVTAIANAAEQAEQIRTAAEALVLKLKDFEYEEWAGNPDISFADFVEVELTALKGALSRGWLSRGKAPQDNCPHLHTKRLVLPANKRKQFDEPFAYHCTDCNRTFGEEPEAKL